MSKVEFRPDGSIRLVSSNLRTHLALFGVLLLGALAALAFSVTVHDATLAEVLKRSPVFFLFLFICFPRASVRRVVELEPFTRRLRVSLEARSFFKWNTVPLWSAGFDQVMAMERVCFGPGEARGGSFDIVVRVEGETRFLASVSGTFHNQSLLDTLRGWLSERSAALPQATLGGASRMVRSSSSSAVTKLPAPPSTRPPFHQ